MQTGRMKSGARSAWGMILAIVMSHAPAVAAEKTYELPLEFIHRQLGQTPKAGVMELTAERQAQLKRILGHDYPTQRLRYWSQSGKHVWVLDEIGKTEPITAGVAVQNHAITELKVLIYRESHGWEVSRPFFSKQFTGASLAGSKLDRGIDGIVGATLSVRALTKMSTAALYLDSQVSD